MFSSPHISMCTILLDNYTPCSWAAVGYRHKGHNLHTLADRELQFFLLGSPHDHRSWRWTRPTRSPAPHLPRRNVPWAIITTALSLSQAGGLPSCPYRDSSTGEATFENLASPEHQSWEIHKDTKSWNVWREIIYKSLEWEDKGEWIQSVEEQV